MKTINFVPLGNKVVVMMPDVVEQSSSGLIKSPEQIAEEKRKLLNDSYLTIIAVSTDVTKVKPGVQVMLTAEMIRPITVDGEIYGLIDVDHLQGYKI